jgi:hypothetical protein
MRWPRTRLSLRSSLAVVLCASVLMTSLGNEGLITAVRGEVTSVHPADRPVGNPALALLQSREFAGTIGARPTVTPLVAHVVEAGICAVFFWPLQRAERNRFAISSRVRLHSLYCVWIV